MQLSLFPVLSGDSIVEAYLVTLKYSSAGVTSSAVFTVGHFIKLQCSSWQQDPYHRTQGIFSVIPLTS